MAKTKTPFFSFGSRGTVGGVLTAQKRGRATLLRLTPKPTDPKSQAQLAQRQRYKDAVAVWNALSLEEKEAWRGVCPGLTAYQCLMSSELKYVPPPLPIYIGEAAIVRAADLPSGSTQINTGKPANASGTITLVGIFPSYADLVGCKVGIFYKTRGATLKCRSATTIGAVVKGEERTFGVTLAAQAGDCIGTYYSGGYLAFDHAGYHGRWSMSGDHCIVDDESPYVFNAGEAISLYGTGEQAA